MKIQKRNSKGFYTVDGKLYPSVTTILKDMDNMSGLLFWYGKHGYDEASRILEAHSNYGKALHKCFEDYYFNNMSVVDPEFLPRIEQFNAWLKEMNFTPECGEQTVVNHELGYAGTCDLVVKDPLGVRAIVDYKTGSERRFKEILQLSAYANCFPDRVLFGYIARMGKESEATIKMIKYDGDLLTKAFDMFKKCLEIYRFKEELKHIKKKAGIKNEDHSA